MANRIKGITVEIGGDTTKLQTALKGVNGQIRNTQSALKDVEKLLKLDPTNTTLLAQRQSLLNQAISETKEKLTTLKTAAQQANEQLQIGGITQAQYDALQREIIETESELRRLETQASETNQTLSNIGEVGSKLESVGNKIADVGRKVTVVSTAVTAMGGAAVKTAADFESSMSQVQATMGITKDSMSTLDGQSVNTMDTLSDLAKEMGAKTAFSASECAEALNYLALAGYDTQEMADTLPIVLNLAAAGGIELSSASDMVTDAMSALGMETEYADKMVDQMAKTASSTNTSVSQLGEGILAIGATAKSIKGGTAELNTALGILANNGIKGTEGGTHLRNVILALQNPTDKAVNTMKALGISVFDSEGNMRSLNDILGDLNASMENMTAEEKTNIISRIFNKTDLSSVNALLANTGQAWDEMQNSIENSGGVAQQMADTQLDNLSGQLTILKSAVEGFAISIGETLMPTVKNIVARLQAFVDWLNSLDDGTRQVIVRIGLFIAVLGPALVVIGTVISKVGIAMKAFSNLGLKITGLVSKAGGLSGVMSKVGTAIMGINPVAVAVVAGIAVLVGAFVHLWKTNEDFRNKITAIWERIKNIFSGFTQGITDRLNALGLDFSNFTEVVSTIWNGLCELLAPVLEGAFTQISNILEATLNIILGVIDVFIGIFTGNWSQVWNGIKDIFISVWEFISNSFSDFIGSLYDFADVVLGWFGTSVAEIQTKVSGLLANLKGYVTGFFKGLLSKMKLALENIKKIITTDIGIIKNSIFSICNNIKSGISSYIDGIKSSIIRGFQDAIAYIKDIIAQAKSWGSDMIQNIINGLHDKISELADSVIDVANTIRAYLHFSVPDKGPLTDYESWMPDFMQGMAKGIEKSRGMIQQAIKNVSDDMVITSSLNTSLINGNKATANSSNVVNNNKIYNFNQTNNSPKALSRFDIYRQSKNLLSAIKGR